MVLPVLLFGLLKFLVVVKERVEHQHGTTKLIRVYKQKVQRVTSRCFSRCPCVLWWTDVGDCVHWL